MSDFEEQESSVNPMNYLKIFFRRKELLIIPAIIGLILGICAGIILPKKFQSSTILLVEEGKTDNPLFDQLAVSTTVGQRMNAIRESMLEQKKDDTHLLPEGPEKEIVKELKREMKRAAKAMDFSWPRACATG